MNTFIRRTKSFTSTKSIATNDTSIDDSLLLIKKNSRVSQLQRLSQLNRTMSEPVTPRNKSINITTLKSFHYSTKTSDEIRFEYYSKLVYNCKWNPNQSKTKLTNTLIFFDWDDTLLFTSLLINKNTNSLRLNINEFTSKELDQIKRLELKIITLFNKAISKGDTYIITNSQPGWVENTAAIFYPCFKDTVLNKGVVKVVSARGLYEKFFPNDVRMWKICAFEQIQSIYNVDLVTNIISIGDSFLEIEAGKQLAKYFHYNVVKTLQFNHYTKIDELAFQVELVCDRFDYIVNNAKNWTIKVNKTKNK